MVALMFGGLSHAKDWSVIYREATPSIPILTMSGGYCSGSLIEADLILTAAHCVAPLRRLQIAWPKTLDTHSDKAKKPVVTFEDATVIALDKKLDLALIKLAQAKVVAPLKIAAKEKPLSPGDEVATIGHPATPEMSWSSNQTFKQDETYLISTGVVSGLSEEDLISDMSLTPGNSGGPVLNRDGELVAVVSRKRIGPAVGAIGYSTQKDKIHSFVNEFKADKKSPVTWLQAQSRSEFSVAVSDGNLLETERRSRFWSTGLELRLAFLDRLYFGYYTNLNGTPRLSSWLIGPKFVFTLNSGHAWVLSPQAEMANLRYIEEATQAEQNEKFWMYSLFLRTTRFPVALKVSAVPRSGKTEWLFNFHLPAFSF